MVQSLATSSKVFHDFCSTMARDLNAIVVAPSYRLAPEHRLPAAYEDGTEALDWIGKSDDEWIRSHADFSNVFLMGTSAGIEICRFRLRSDSVTDPWIDSTPSIRLVNDRILPPVITHVFWDLCLPVGVDRDHEYSNPTVGGGSENLERIGVVNWKVMVIGGEEDPMVDRQRDFAEVMKKKGIEVTEKFTGGDAHAAQIFDPSKRETLFVSV
ncbi:unnamed protein product [Arabis nemorensis]|uniref:Alpha/beta hydrolase fold-3 domain-containing protein n=1 Tax=Arabis nemorensis TaxID=586526 RepID=A0A565CVC9_9BRAS|nr:unnamed protein product [Arabis nemorensis]